MRTMRRSAMVGVALVALSALLGCASSTRRLPFEPNELDPDYWVPKVDRFVVILDDSLSMGDRYHREAKIDMATDLARTMNASIPELDYQAGFRTFGQGRCLPHEKTSLLAAFDRYSTAAFRQAIDRVQCANGNSPLNLALDASGKDLAGPKGALAMIIISDGRNMGRKELASARRLKDRFGDALCIYPVLIGNDARGRRLLGQIASIGGCGKLVRGDDLSERGAMGEFVKQALLWPDSDGDGVPDHLDTCPDTPRGVKVDEHGCPPKPERAAVPPWPIQGVPLFAIDHWDLDAEDRAVLDQVAEHLTANPDIVVEVQGHTDSTGPKSWNMILSERRAESAKKYLVSKGVADSRLTTKGYGPDRPAVPNDSRANRAMNRRVSFQPAWRQ